MRRHADHGQVFPKCSFASHEYTHASIRAETGRHSEEPNWVLAPGLFGRQVQREHRLLRGAADNKLFESDGLPHVLRARRSNLGQSRGKRCVRCDNLADDS